MNIQIPLLLTNFFGATFWHAVASLWLRADGSQLSERQQNKESGGKTHRTRSLVLWGKHSDLEGDGPHLGYGGRRHETCQPYFDRGRGWGWLVDMGKGWRVGWGGGRGGERVRVSLSRSLCMHLFRSGASLGGCLYWLADCPFVICHSLSISGCRSVCVCVFLSASPVYSPFLSC